MSDDGHGNRIARGWAVASEGSGARRWYCPICYAMVLEAHTEAHDTYHAQNDKPKPTTPHIHVALYSPPAQPRWLR